MGETSGRDEVGTDVLDEMLRRAAASAERAYAPYSGFHVGAAVLASSGAIYAGANVENISFPVGICAEAVALGAAVAAEGPAFGLRAVAILATKGGKSQPCSPCGACRQRIVEFNKSAPVYFRSRRAKLVCKSASTLLPHQFSFESGPT